MPVSKASWTAGNPTFTVDASGTANASVILKDSGVVAVTINLTMTADHGLVIKVVSAPGDAGLTAFEAWSNK